MSKRPLSDHEEILLLKQQMEAKKMSAEPDAPELTDNKEVNNQLIMYFWWLILLSFAGQLIGYLIQWISGTINQTVLLILCLQAVQTLLIGGAVKLVQRQVQSVSEKYNASVKQKKLDNDRIAALEKENEDVKKQLSNRDAEIIAFKTKTIVDTKPMEEKKV